MGDQWRSFNHHTSHRTSSQVAKRSWHKIFDPWLHQMQQLRFTPFTQDAASSIVLWGHCIHLLRDICQHRRASGTIMVEQCVFLDPREMWQINSNRLPFTRGFDHLSELLNRLHKRNDALVNAQPMWCKSLSCSDSFYLSATVKIGS